MTKIGGPKELTDAIKSAGGDVGPRSTWVTSGIEKWGWGGFDQFLAGCKADGAQPLVFFWTWGDAISPTVFATGVQDKYQGVFITQAKCIAWATEIARRSKVAGLAPIVVIEHEMTKGGVTENATQFNAYFGAIVAALKAENPGVKTAICPGIWSNMNTVATNFAPSIAKADIIGLQTLLFRPRHSEAEFTAAGINLNESFKFLKGTSGKPCALVDLGFSSYGGPYATIHPFAGGNGQAEEKLQAAAILSVKSVPVEFIVYRGLSDNPNFNVANFGGYAERHVGVQRTDGTKKPGYDALVALAKPIVVTYTQAQMDAVRAELAVSRTREAEAILGRDAALLEAATWKKKVEAARAALI